MLIRETVGPHPGPTVSPTSSLGRVVNSAERRFLIYPWT
jgi:hypothetical protein